MRNYTHKIIAISIAMLTIFGTISPQQVMSISKYKQKKQIQTPTKQHTSTKNYKYTLYDATLEFEDGKYRLNGKFARNNIGVDTYNRLYAKKELENNNQKFIFVTEFPTIKTLIDLNSISIEHHKYINALRNSLPYSYNSFCPSTSDTNSIHTNYTTLSTNKLIEICKENENFTENICNKINQYIDTANPTNLCNTFLHPSRSIQFSIDLAKLCKDNKELCITIDIATLEVESLYKDLKEDSEKNSLINKYMNYYWNNNMNLRLFNPHMHPLKYTFSNKVGFNTSTIIGTDSAMNRIDPTYKIDITQLIYNMQSFGLNRDQSTPFGTLYIGKSPFITIKNDITLLNSPVQPENVNTLKKSSINISDIGKVYGSSYKTLSVTPIIQEIKKNENKYNITWDVSVSTR